MRPCQTKSLDRAVRKGENYVLWRDLAHGFVERIDLVVSLSFGGPNIFTEEFLSKGLLVIDPPKVHFLQK